MSSKLLNLGSCRIRISPRIYQGVRHRRLQRSSLLAIFQQAVPICEVKLRRYFHLSRPLSCAATLPEEHTMMSARVCPTSKALRVRAPSTAARSTSRSAPPRILKTLAAHENRVASTVAAGIVAAGLLLAQPVLAAGIVNPDGTASVPKLGDVVNKTFSKLFPAGAFDKALDVAKEKGLGGNASVTEVGESKSVTQLLNEVAEPSPARKSPIARAARKFEPDVDPTYVAKPKKDKGPALAGVESEAPENQTSTAGSSIGNPPPKGTPSSF